MSNQSRKRLSRIVRDPGCDLAEAALLICCETEPDLDVEVELLRIDALADALRTRGFSPTDPEHDAIALGSYLAETLGFSGDEMTYHDPANALLTRVLDRKRGLPITLSILYVAIARRVGIQAFGIGLPGHFVTGVGTGGAGNGRPVVIDPFNDGQVLEEADIAERVRTSTGGRLEYHRAMLRPAAPPVVIRRVLNNLSRDFTNLGDLQDALWTIELKQLLPNRVPDDHRARGELLQGLGQFRRAAEAFEAYLEDVDHDAPDREEVLRSAIEARAKLN